MAALVWGAWGVEWAQNKKVSFNGLDRTITVNGDVTSLDLQADVWSRWVDWASLPGNDYHTLAMRRTGFDVIPGGRSGLIFFLQNGWKLVLDPSKVRIFGVLYSDDYETAYWSESGQPIYPVIVSALVNSTVSTVPALTQDNVNALLAAIEASGILAKEVTARRALEMAQAAL
jgi:hypothetical protein